MTNDAYPWSAGFRSLNEEHDYRIEEIDGQVPATLRGTLFRNGSGRNELGGQWFLHWFDGDGMISSLRFGDDGIRFRNRYVRTDNYRDETAAGHIMHRGFGKMRPGGILANAFRLPANVSNTSVLMEGDRLLSLWEGGPPIVLDPNPLEVGGGVVVMRLTAEEVRFLSEFAVDMPTAIRRAVDRLSSESGSGPPQDVLPAEMP